MSKSNFLVIAIILTLSSFILLLFSLILPIEFRNNLYISVIISIAIMGVVYLVISRFVISRYRNIGRIILIIIISLTLYFINGKEFIKNWKTEKIVYHHKGSTKRTIELQYYTNGEWEYKERLVYINNLLLFNIVKEVDTNDIDFTNDLWIKSSLLNSP